MIDWTVDEVEGNERHLDSEQRRRQLRIARWGFIAVFATSLVGLLAVLVSDNPPLTAVFGALALGSSLGILGVHVSLRE